MSYVITLDRRSFIHKPVSGNFQITSGSGLYLYIGCLLLTIHHFAPYLVVFFNMLPLVYNE